MDEKHQNGIILESSLQTFFFDELTSLNKKSSSPLPNETIFYSSQVLDRLADTFKLFEENEGRLENKVLGIKLMELANKKKRDQKRTLRDVGETSLIVCGFFSESLKKKLVDVDYYLSLGAMAYKQLNHFIPSFMDVPHFYEQFSEQFPQMTNLMSFLPKGMWGDSWDQSEQDVLWILSEKNKIKAS